MSAGAAQRAKDALILNLETELRRSEVGRSEDSEPPIKAPRVEAAGPPPAPSTTSKSSFMKELHDILEEQEDSGAASSSSTTLVQVQSYLTEPTVPVTDNPFQYWAVNRLRLPGLAAFAAKYLSAPCTSVESERLFSTVSDIVDEKRNRLTAERAEMLVFLRKNLSLLLSECSE